MNDSNEITNQQSGAGASAQSSQEPVSANVPPPPPRSREVKQDVVSDEQNIFEEERKSKK